MDQRRIRRMIAAAALATTLGLAPPARAAGMGMMEPGLFAKGWRWLTEIGSWTGASHPAPAARQGSRQESKRSAGIDPNGLQAAFAPLPSLSDGSVSVDPQR